MTNESHPEVQEFTAKQNYSTGTFLMFSALLPLATELAKYNSEFINTLHISSSVAVVLFIVGYFFRAKAKKELNKLYKQKETSASDTA